MDEDRGSGEGCLSAAGPKSLRLTMRLETLKRSGLFLVDLDFYNRVKARVLRGRGARLSGSNAADGIAGRPRLENGVPEISTFQGMLNASEQ
jgi:hypothetical protein